MNRTITRPGAILAGAALTVAALPLLGSTGASAATGQRDVSTTTPLNYVCDYITEVVPLRALETTIDASFTVPSRLYPGQVIAPTAVNIDLTPYYLLAGAARDFFGAVEADGASDDAAVDVTTAEGTSQSYLLQDLKAERAPVPAEATEEDPWVIKATGTAPAITVPSTSSIRIRAPREFTVDAKVYDAENNATAVDIACRAAQSSTTIATLKVSKLYPKLTTKAVPTDVVANRTRPTITVKGYSEKTPTGAVEVREGSRVLGTGTLKNGSAAVQLPVFGKKGTRNLTVAYAGDVSNNAATSTTSITVR